jgi:hypothetical protein
MPAGILYLEHPWSLEELRTHKAKLFQQRIQVKRTIMKVQDWPYRHDNGCMVPILRTVWFDTNHHGYTPTGSIPFTRTPYRVNLLSQLYILRIVRRGYSSLSDWALRRTSNRLKAYVLTYGNQLKNNLLWIRFCCQDHCQSSLWIIS